MTGLSSRTRDTHTVSQAFSRTERTEDYDYYLTGLPQWKQDLLLARRRAANKAGTDLRIHNGTKAVNEHSAITRDSNSYRTHEADGGGVLSPLRSEVTTPALTAGNSTVGIEQHSTESPTAFTQSNAPHDHGQLSDPEVTFTLRLQQREFPIKLSSMRLADDESTTASAGAAASLAQISHANRLALGGAEKNEVLNNRSADQVSRASTIGTRSQPFVNGSGLPAPSSQDQPVVRLGSRGDRSSWYRPPDEIIIVEKSDVGSSTGSTGITAEQRRLNAAHHSANGREQPSHLFDRRFDAAAELPKSSTVHRVVSQLEQIQMEAAAPRPPPRRKHRVPNAPISPTAATAVAGDGLLFANRVETVLAEPAELPSNGFSRFPATTGFHVRAVRAVSGADDPGYGDRPRSATFAGRDRSGSAPQQVGAPAPSAICGLKVLQGKDHPVPVPALPPCLNKAMSLGEQPPSLSSLPAASLPKDKGSSHNGSLPRVAADSTPMCQAASAAPRLAPSVAPRLQRPVQAPLSRAAAGNSDSSVSIDAVDAAAPAAPSVELPAVTVPTEVAVLTAPVLSFRQSKEVSRPAALAPSLASDRSQSSNAVAPAAAKAALPTADAKLATAVETSLAMAPAPAAAKASVGEGAPAGRTFGGAAVLKSPAGAMQQPSGSAAELLLAFSRRSAGSSATVTLSGERQPESGTGKRVFDTRSAMTQERKVPEYEKIFDGKAVVFYNDNIVIANGNLRKSASAKALQAVTFNSDYLSHMFEYPSEESLLDCLPKQADSSYYDDPPPSTINSTTTDADVDDEPARTRFGALPLLRNVQLEGKVNGKPQVTLNMNDATQPSNTDC